MNIKEELEALRLEKEKLEVEALRDQIEKSRREKEAKRLASEQQEKAIKESQRQEELRQKVCNHRKGGMGLEGMVSGNDSNYSVIKHQLSTGDFMVLCTRCCKQWSKKDQDFQAALAFPTDNQPSGSVLFANTYQK